ncbi:hypothetical protein DICA1_A01728 [Diutina catenulata]
MLIYQNPLSPAYCNLASLSAALQQVVDSQMSSHSPAHLPASQSKPHPEASERHPTAAPAPPYSTDETDGKYTISYEVTSDDVTVDFDTAANTVDVEFDTTDGRIISHVGFVAPVSDVVAELRGSTLVVTGYKTDPDETSLDVADNAPRADAVPDAASSDRQDQSRPEMVESPRNLHAAGDTPQGGHPASRHQETGQPDASGGHETCSRGSEPEPDNGAPEVPGSANVIRVFSRRPEAPRA